MDKLTDKFQGFLFLLPTLLLIGIFVLYPFIMGVIYSFTDWNGVTVSKFVWTDNYLRLFADNNFKDAVFNTLLYGIFVTLVTLPLGLFIAVILGTKALHMRGIFRTLVYLPSTLSLLIVANIFNIILVYDGILDHLFWLMGHVGNLIIMGSSELMRVSMIVIMVWSGLGSCMVFFLAGIQGIPREIHEAAMVDGANGVARFFRITLPLLRPTIMIVTFIILNGALKTFDLPFRLTGGGPGTATLSVAMLIYKQAFAFNTAGYATTTGIILLIIVSLLAYLQIRVTAGKGEDIL
jgi:ABC-type sugar transport system permease subunit